MKKVFFGLAFFLIMALSSTISFSQESVDPANYQFRWKQRICPSTGEAYETCWLTGDGNTCTTYNESTRSCPGW